jgi:hypothetical protein
MGADRDEGGDRAEHPGCEGQVDANDGVDDVRGCFFGLARFGDELAASAVPAAANARRPRSTPILSCILSEVRSSTRKNGRLAW